MQYDASHNLLQGPMLHLQKIRMAYVTTFAISKSPYIMNESELVYFDGSFSAHEKGKIGRTILEIEQHLPSVQSTHVGRPWVTVSLDLTGPKRLLVAHRLGTPQAVRASSVDELVAKLQAFPHSMSANS